MLQQLGGRTNGVHVKSDRVAAGENKAGRAVRLDALFSLPATRIIRILPRRCADRLKQLGQRVDKNRWPLVFDIQHAGHVFLGQPPRHDRCNFNRRIANKRDVGRRVFAFEQLAKTPAQHGMVPKPANADVSRLPRVG